MADQLHFIDQQLLQCELSPGEEAAVDDFRVWSLQYRQQRHNELGHFPDDLVERSAWQAKKQQLDESMVPEIKSERLLRGRPILQGASGPDCVQQLSANFEPATSCNTGLTQVWEKHQERDRLRELRETLLEGSGTGKFTRKGKHVFALV